MKEWVARHKKASTIILTILLCIGIALFFTGFALFGLYFLLPLLGIFFFTAITILIYDAAKDMIKDFLK